MTNKRLIRYCNIYWLIDETCDGCKYPKHCMIFHKKTGLPTPFRENKFHPKVYTDEEWEVVNEN